VEFLLLFNERKGTPPPEKEGLAAMEKYSGELRSRGVFRRGGPLAPASTGAGVRVRDGKAFVTDGPFPETKELVAGFWIWKCKSKQEAVEWVKRCPNPMPNTEAEIEIRQVFEAEDFGAEFTPELREQEERLRKEIEGKR